MFVDARALHSVYDFLNEFKKLWFCVFCFSKKMKKKISSFEKSAMIINVGLCWSYVRWDAFNRFQCQFEHINFHFLSNFFAVFSPFFVDFTLTSNDSYFVVHRSEENPFIALLFYIQLDSLHIICFVRSCFYWICVTSAWLVPPFLYLIYLAEDTLAPSHIWIWSVFFSTHFNCAWLTWCVFDIDTVTFVRTRIHNSTVFNLHIWSTQITVGKTTARLSLLEPNGLFVQEPKIRSP